MRPSSPMPAPSGVRGAVVAYAGAVLTAEALPGRRRQPAPGIDLPPSLLKHAEEQTVAALLAVYRALDKPGLDATALSGWGVLVAPELLGRTNIAAVLQGFAEEGAWGMSPHLIPHRSLHSPSGTISQALGLHGPNFGVGGGPGAAAEAFLAAAALLADGRLPGLWLVLTAGAPGGPGLLWQAAALGLVPARPGDTGPWLEVGVGAGPDAGPPSWPPLTLASLLAVLGDGKALRPARWDLGEGAWARLAPARPGAEDRP